ncbi:MAG: sugar phosphate isomerase/epimerase [Acidobacteriota bacterium]
MAMISRRDFFRKTATDAAVAGFLASGAVKLGAAPLGLPIGSQTYPHRAMVLEGNFAGLCQMFVDIGVQSIELCSPSYREFAGLADGKATKKIIDDHGLKCPSAHFGMNVLRTKQPEMIAWAKDIGMTQMATASLGGKVTAGVTTMDEVKRAADEYNTIGAEAAKAGLQQLLHDEGFEMSRVDTPDGRLTYEVLLELLDPKLVKMQFQMSAMRAVGDPVMYFTKYPGRFTSMHLQGVDLNAPMPAARGAAPAGAPPATPAAAAPGGAQSGQAAGRGAGTAAGAGAGGVAVGKDSLDWAKIFAAAKTGGVINYFVEQTWDLTRDSVAFLKKLNV